MLLTHCIAAKMENRIQTITEDEKGKRKYHKMSKTTRTTEKAAALQPARWTKTRFVVIMTIEEVVDSFESQQPLTSLRKLIQDQINLTRSDKSDFMIC